MQSAFHTYTHASCTRVVFFQVIAPQSTLTLYPCKQAQENWIGAAEIPDWGRIDGRKVTDIPRSDYQTILKSIDSASACSAKCTECADCEFFVFDTVDKTCKLSKAFQSAKPDPNKISGMRCCQPKGTETLADIVSKAYSPGDSVQLGPVSGQTTIL